MQFLKHSNATGNSSVHFQRVMNDTKRTSQTVELDSMEHAYSPADSPMPNNESQEEEQLEFERKKTEALIDSFTK